MIKRSLLCVVLLGLLGCCSVPPATPTPPLAGVHLVVAVQGPVSLKREGWSAYAPVLFGTTLRYGDLLRLDASAQATVVCADLSLRRVPSGVGGVPCPVAQVELDYNGSRVNPTRSNPSGDFPLVVAPRKTKLLNPRPTLRWTPVAGTTRYTVSVRGPKVTWSTEVNSGTEVVYPDTAPALLAGATYKVTVVAGNRSSDEEPLPGLGFTLLNTDEAREVRAAETKIRALGLADTPTRLLLANLYASRERQLYAEAIAQLEGLATTAQEAAVPRTLGDLYLTLGLNRLAEERYLQAFARSESAGDMEGQALAQHALGRIDEVLGNPGESAQRLRKAMELYQQLGDGKTVKEIEQRLAGLPKP
jgi:hypothetical protein